MIKQVVITYWFGGLGNNLIQLVNAIDFTSMNNYVFVHKLKHNQINDFIVNFSNDTTITLLNIDEKYPVQISDVFNFNFNLEYPISYCIKSELLRDYVYDHFIQFPVDIDHDTLVIHICNEGFYYQPSLSFYTKIIDEYKKIHIVQHGIKTENTIIDQLIEKYPGITCSTTDENSVILQTSHFVCSSSYGYMLILMSKNIKNLYFPYCENTENLFKDIFHFNIHQTLV